MTENESGKRRPGRPRSPSPMKTTSLRLSTAERALLVEVTSRHGVTQADLLRFILHNAWLLDLPAIEMENLRRKTVQG